MLCCLGKPSSDYMPINTDDENKDSKALSRSPSKPSSFSTTILTSRYAIEAMMDENIVTFPGNRPRSINNAYGTLYNAYESSDIDISLNSSSDATPTLSNESVSRLKRNPHLVQTGGNALMAYDPTTMKDLVRVVVPDNCKAGQVILVQHPDPDNSRLAHAVIPYGKDTPGSSFLVQFPPHSTALPGVNEGLHHDLALDKEEDEEGFLVVPSAFTKSTSVKRRNSTKYNLDDSFVVVEAESLTKVASSPTSVAASVTQDSSKSIDSGSSNIENEGVGTINTEQRNDNNSTAIWREMNDNQVLSHLSNNKRSSFARSTSSPPAQQTTLPQSDANFATFSSKSPKSSFSNFTNKKNFNKSSTTTTTTAQTGDKYTLLVQIPPSLAPGSCFHVRVPNQNSSLNQYIPVTVPPGGASQMYVPYTVGETSSVMTRSSSPTTVLNTKLFRDNPLAYGTPLLVLPAVADSKL